MSKSAVDDYGTRDTNYVSVGTSSSENDVKSGLNDRKLKFGIDRILSSRDTCDNDKSTDSAVYYSHCFNRTLYCCQMSPVVPSYSSLYPPLYITTNSYMPTVRKYTNFVIEGERSTFDDGISKRKRIWSRAVFSKLQRKGLEKRFQVQKYIMKPDRKQLAATLGLTDAQVKVWFQNRRMKWRNNRENSNKSTSDEVLKQSQN